jgi:hypothetical protein
MPILRIEHPVPDFDAWKAAFESDPLGREQSGVHRYTVLRPIDDPNYVMVDVEFDNASEAEAMRAALKEMWRRVEAEGLSGANERRSSKPWRRRSTRVSSELSRSTPSAWRSREPTTALTSLVRERLRKHVVSRPDASAVRTLGSCRQVSPGGTDRSSYVVNPSVWSSTAGGGHDRDGPLAAAEGTLLLGHAHRAVGP